MPGTSGSPILEVPGTSDSRSAWHLWLSTSDSPDTPGHLSAHRTRALRSARLSEVPGTSRARLNRSARHLSRPTPILQVPDSRSAILEVPGTSHRTLPDTCPGSPDTPRLSEVPDFRSAWHLQRQHLQRQHLQRQHFQRQHFQRQHFQRPAPPASACSDSAGSHPVQDRCERVESLTRELREPTHVRKLLVAVVVIARGA